MDKWAELRTAYQVAKLGTVSAAADVLGFHRATVNRHIDVLEEAIGARIFIRHSRGYTLTEIGEQVLRAAQKTEELINDMAGRVRSGKSELEGEIKITMLAPFSDLIMKPVAEFRRQHPKCRVHIIATEDLARLEYGEAHVALRVGTRPDHPDYVVRTFDRVHFNLYAHESYVQRFGLPENLENMEGHDFVVPPLEGKLLPFIPWVREYVKPEQYSVSSNHMWVNLHAISEGLGMGFLSQYDVAGRDDFHQILPHNESWFLTVWQVTHVDLHRTEKVQALLKSLKAALKARD
ncbi:LysR family transcriptional regulator [Granulosicoccus antarcticus]|uniref:HTH-type transcriptional regulator DmlR n=1 Tax=Granulosicoccus antarcticus IMCC3135 TaxID=1192854 RepID=A0A2Z2P135_9GAMM|nr:LysR family transcriptional regulator [Granulosicoccus antarcticus]ASJ74027.1 HTH-type transcriptional regulator DmlR [Granulosicoccus antarcticus IMCC3135]